jgi:hypothetical protein
MCNSLPTPIYEDEIALRSSSYWARRHAAERGSDLINRFPCSRRDAQEIKEGVNHSVVTRQRDWNSGVIQTGSGRFT